MDQLSQQMFWTGPNVWQGVLVITAKSQDLARNNATSLSTPGNFKPSNQTFQGDGTCEELQRLFPVPSLNRPGETTPQAGNESLSVPPDTRAIPSALSLITTHQPLLQSTKKF